MVWPEPGSQEHVLGRQVRPRPQAQPNERGNVDHQPKDDTGNGRYCDEDPTQLADGLDL
jgi:hypothetical protein